MAEYGDNKKINYVVTSESASLNSPQGAGNFPATTMTGLSDGAALTFIVKADHETGSVSASGQNNSVTPAAAMLTVTRRWSRKRRYGDGRQLGQGHHRDRCV